MPESEQLAFISKRLAFYQSEIGEPDDHTITDEGSSPSEGDVWYDSNEDDEVFRETLVNPPPMLAA